MRGKIGGKIAAAVIVAAALFSSGCAGKRIRPVVPYEGPVTVEVLRKSILFESIKTLVSEARVRVFKGKKKIGTVKGVFAYMNPDSMRLRVFDPFGFTVLEVLMSDTLMQVVAPDALYEGEVPSIGFPDGLRYIIEKKKDGYVLYALRPAGPGASDFELERQYSFDLALKNTGISVYRGGRVFIDINLGGYDGRVPTAMKLAFFNGFRTELTFIRGGIDEEIPPEHFQPVSPEGRAVLPLEDLYRKGRY